MKDELDLMFEAARDDFFVRTGYREEQVRAALAESVERLRKAQGLSIRELASRMHTSVSQVERLLNEDIGSGLTLRTIVRAADVLNSELVLWLSADVTEDSKKQADALYSSIQESAMALNACAPPGNDDYTFTTLRRVLSARCLQESALGRKVLAWHQPEFNDVMPLLTVDSKGEPSWL